MPRVRKNRNRAKNVRAQDKSHAQSAKALGNLKLTATPAMAKARTRIKSNAKHVVVQAQSMLIAKNAKGKAKSLAKPAEAPD